MFLKALCLKCLKIFINKKEYGNFSLLSLKILLSLYNNIKSMELSKNTAISDYEGNTSDMGKSTPI